MSSPARVRRTATLAVAPGADEADRIEVFQPVRLQKATDEVCIAVLDALRGGLFTVGDRLPRERDLAERFEVSSNTVSQALAILEQAGIIRQRRGRYGGTYVVSLANVRAVLASMLATSQSDSRAELRNLLELRRPLELQAAVLTAERADEEQLGQLRRIAEALRPDLPVGDREPEAPQDHLGRGRSSGSCRGAVLGRAPAVCVAARKMLRAATAAHTASSSRKPHCRFAAASTASAADPIALGQR